MLYDEPPIQAQGGVDQRLSQGPVHHGGGPPGIARISQDKYGARILDKIVQPQHIHPGRRRLKILFIGENIVSFVLVDARLLFLK